MRVRLEAIDSTLPNLALMKLSAFHKQMGDIVGFNISNPDLVYISVIFTQNIAQAKGVATYFPEADVLMGGPGLGEQNELDLEVEHIMPDYSLYLIDYSIGFTTRGCIRKCPFCIVPELEGRFREHADISEFHHPDHKKIILFDNNILASKKLFHTLDYIKEHKLKVCFSQGLDARLVTDEIAEALKDVKAYNTSFLNKRYYFAWDLMEEEEGVIQGLQTMIRAGIRPQNIMVYVLVGFNTTYKQDLYRVNKLRELGVLPWVMIYNFNRDDPWLKCFMKWSNRMFQQYMEFSEFKPYQNLVRKKHENPY